MSIDLKELRLILRELADLVADEAEQNPKFAAKLENFLVSSRELKPRKAKKDETPIIDPFEAFTNKGSEQFQEWLQTLSIEDLRAVVRQHRLDPSRKSDRWKNKDKLIDLITKRVADRSQQGTAFRHYETDISEKTKTSDETIAERHNSKSSSDKT